MPRLQVELSQSTYDQLKSEAFSKGMKLGYYIEQRLLGKQEMDKRNPEVQMVVDAFEQMIGKMPRPTMQRRAASTLIKRHSLERVLGAINAVAACRGERYAPGITSLEHLRDKWIDLENFYKRQASPEIKRQVLKV